MTIDLMENIRKTMGWCPNASEFETRKPAQFDCMSEGASGGIGGAIRKISEKQGIKGALIIVGIYAILNALGVYITTEKIIYVYEGYGNFDMGNPMSMMKQFILVGALGAAFILWLAVTGIIHIISKVLGGKGKFYPQMMTTVGYSFIPMILAGLISLILLFLVEPVTITLSPENPAAGREIYDNPYIFGSSVIAAILQVFSSVILFFGVQSVQKLTPGKSAIVAGIPLVFFIISLGRIRLELAIILILAAIVTICMAVFLKRPYYGQQREQ